jgi:cellulose synthase/poly-beta-1,6-N-acetylglucosamine synthase-like glycosyltransferase
MMKIVFFSSILLIAYTYIGYPLILAALNSLPFLKKNIIYKEEGPELPAVSLLIAAHNEENVIEEKIKNCLNLDYPEGKLQIVVGSDGSTDTTSEIVKRYQRDRRNLVLCAFSQREGKPATINKIVKFAAGDILLFSDADTFLKKDALKRIVDNFRDNSIGCVCGRIDIESAGCGGAGESIYWGYELWLKEMESGIGSVLGAAGGLYAMRRGLWEDIPADTLIDDFVISMKLIEKGYRVVYEKWALAYEEAAASTEQEFIRRVRIGAGGFQSISLIGGLLNPLKGFIAWEFWSHKVIRWFGPFLL